MPLQRRIPKRGFVNIFATKYVTVNVGDLEAKFENEAVIDAEALKACGLIKKVCDGVKVLGNGEVTKNFTVKAAAFSASAKEIYAQLADSFVCEYDEAGSIGKRYRRQDAIGTPFCVTIDFDTEKDGCVTVRERDSMEQVRLPISELQAHIEASLKF